MQNNTRVKMVAAAFAVAACISSVYGAGNVPAPAFSFKYGGKPVAGSESL